MNTIALYDGMNVSRETIERLNIHVALLRKWSPVINLVSKSTIENAWERHVLDSAQVLPLVPKTAERIVDLGSGAGFPGITLAILLKEGEWSPEIILVESDKRKAAFLREVIRETGVSASVTTQRAESLGREADVITARGFAPLNALLEIADPIIGQRGIALLHKGARYESELTEAVKSWHMDTDIHQSRVDPASVILRIGGLKRRQGEA